MLKALFSCGSGFLAKALCSCGSGVPAEALFSCGSGVLAKALFSCGSGVPAAIKQATAGRSITPRASPPEAGKSAGGGQVHKGVTPRRDRVINSMLRGRAF
jgi:hypothetical protein